MVNSTCFCDVSVKSCSVPNITPFSNSQTDSNDMSQNTRVARCVKQMRGDEGVKTVRDLKAFSPTADEDPDHLILSHSCRSSPGRSHSSDQHPYPPGTIFCNTLISIVKPPLNLLTKPSTHAVLSGYCCF